MELTISAGDGEALEQFYRWLREGVDDMRAARVGMTASPGSGHLARLLRAGERNGDMVELLDAAVGTAKERSSLIGLVNALWVAGLRDEVDGLIGRAVNSLAESVD